MKKFSLPLFAIGMLLFSVMANAQQLNFSYDAAGNQTERKWICVNCRPSGSTASTAETTPLKVDVKLLDTAKNITIKRTITASPNPFLENLNVSWQVESGVSVKNITVFNISGMKMTDVDPVPSQNTITIPFQRFATGMYIVYITFSDQRKESIKVIKK